MVRHRHFRRVPPHHADHNHHRAANKQRHSAAFHEVNVPVLHSVLVECVVKQHQAGQTQQQASHHKVPKHHNPMEPRLVNHSLARHQIRINVTHSLFPSTLSRFHQITPHLNSKRLSQRSHSFRARLPLTLG